MPKILHVISQIPAQTGSGIFFQNMVHQGQKSGWVQGALIGLPQALSDIEIEGIPPSYTYKILFETAQLPYKIPGMSDVMPYPSTVFSEMTPTELETYQRAFEEVFRAAIENFQPDVILSHHLWFATATLCRVLDKLKPASTLQWEFGQPMASRPKLFAVCHGTDLRQMLLSPHLAPYVIEGCQKADGILTISALQNPIISEMYGIDSHKIHLIGGGYDGDVFYAQGRNPLVFERHSSEFAPSAVNFKKIELVYAGKLAGSKGLFELIHAVEQLDPSKFRLRIAGNGSGNEAQSLLQAITNSKADIEYVGQLTQSQLASLFRESDCFVLPSYYEGLSLVAIEALACGMHLIVNCLEGLQEWLGEVINESGRVCYVKMPQLLGPDQCMPEEKEGYCKELARCIEARSHIIESHLQNKKASDTLASDALENYYKAIEEKSWTHVFVRAAEAFSKEGVSFSNPFSA